MRYKRPSLYDNAVEIPHLNSFKQPSRQGSERQSGFTEAEMGPVCVHTTWHGCKTLAKKGEEGV